MRRARSPATTTASDGPTTLTKASASRKPGTVWKASVTRISTSSTRPPAKPASVPTTEPTAIDARPRRAPTASEVRAPWTMPGEHVAAEPVGAERQRPVAERAAAAARPAIASGSRGKRQRREQAPPARSAARSSAPAIASGEREEAARARHAAALAGADARVEQAHRRCRRARLIDDDQHRADEDDAEQERRVARERRPPAPAGRGRGSRRRFSMTTLPPSMAADCRPSMVTSGRSALRATCAQHDAPPATDPARGRRARNPCARPRPCRRASCAGRARGR